ncbi:hypothetical protein Tco_0745049, partial [Tanacetum coccineum]
HAEFDESNANMLERFYTSAGNPVKEILLKLNLPDHAGTPDDWNVALENEKDSLDRKVIDLLSLVSAKDLELKDLNVVVSSLKSQNDGLVDQVYALETTCSSLRDPVLGYERLKEQIEEFQDAQMNIRWLLTRGLKLVVVKCLNLSEYLTALGSAISHAIEKGMQSGMSANIDHGKAGRSLADVVAYNPAAEADYYSALQRLRESPLADAPGMSDLQPDVEQLMLPIHRPEDQVVLGKTSLSFALSVSHSRVEKVRENILAQWSALVDVWVPLVDPLSAKNLMGAAGTSNSVPSTVVTTTALSTTFASTSSVPPITIEDYEIACTDGQDDA